MLLAMLSMHAPLYNITAWHNEPAWKVTYTLAIYSIYIYTHTQHTRIIIII